MQQPRHSGRVSAPSNSPPESRIPAISAARAPNRSPCASPEDPPRPRAPSCAPTADRGNAAAIPAPHPTIGEQALRRSPKATTGPVPDGHRAQTAESARLRSAPDGSRDRRGAPGAASRRCSVLRLIRGSALGLGSGLVQLGCTSRPRSTARTVEPRRPNLWVLGQSGIQDLPRIRQPVDGLICGDQACPRSAIFGVLLGQSLKLQDGLLAPALLEQK